MLLQALWLYSPKILISVIGVVCCRNIDILHGLLLIFLIVGILIKNKHVEKGILNLVLALISLLILSIMTSKTGFFNQEALKSNCNGKYDFLIFANPGRLKFESNVSGYFFILLIATLLRGIKFYNLSGDFYHDVIFPNVSRSDLDNDVVGAFKFIINYGFHKFGVEICKIGMAALVISRSDVFSIANGIALLLILTLSRKNLTRIWWFLQAFVAFCIVYQYIIALATLPPFCLDLFSTLDEPLRKWLFLPHGTKIESIPVGQVILLVLLSEQYTIFSIEKSKNYPAGSNQEIFRNFSSDYENPVHDHTTHSRYGIDYCKSILFYILYWGGLIVGFIIGGTRSDLISLVYLITSFIIIWQDADLALWQVNRLRKWWNAFMFYSVLCMVLKSTSTELICFVKDGPYYWIWTLILGSVCGSTPTLFWDLIAFAFFLFQRRFIESNYFLHYVNDIKATIELKSCGAALFLKLKREKVHLQKRERDQTVDKIKADMAIIKEHTKRINVMEPSTHDDAILSGDYFMFEDGGRPAISEPREEGQDFLEGLNLKIRKPDNCKEPSVQSFQVTDQTKESKKRIFKIVEMLLQILSHWVQTLIDFLNYISRDFRFVAWAMKIEKAKMKESVDYSHEDVCMVNQLKFSDFERLEEDKQVHIMVFRLLHAAWFTLLDYSELACYLAILFFQVSAPSLIALPIPLMLLLWGALTIHHPSPTFWTTLLAYTEVVLIFKALFRNEFFPWADHINQHGMFYFYSPHVIGVSELTIADVFLLIMLFTHRRKLKSFGLWSDKIKEPVSKTVDFIGSCKPDVDKSLMKYFGDAFQFFKKIGKDSYEFPFDLYTFSFLCEFFLLIVIFVGFSSFVQNRFEDGVFYLAENEVPISYLIALIFQFLVIVIDRMLYLRKNVVGKLFMYLFLVIFSHLWLFIAMPLVTKRHYGELLWPQLWYTVKFISFLISAYQLRNGYPMRVQSYFLARTHNYFSLYAFKVLKFTPFFFPMRHIIGWICIKTSFTLYEWYLFESMYAVIYETKCCRAILIKYPSPRGKPYPRKGKIFNGGLVLIGFFLVIWSPLILFAFFKSVAVPNPPTEVQVTFQINNYPTLYSTRLRNGEILPISLNEFRRLKAMERSNPTGYSYFEQYDYDDVSILKLNPVSIINWNISPPIVDQIKNDAQSNKKFVLNLRFVFHRQEKGTLSQSSFGDLFFPLDSNATKSFIDALQENTSFKLIQKFPRYIESKKGVISPIVFDKGFLAITNVSLVLNPTINNWWWEIEADCLKRTLIMRSNMHDDCEYVEFYVFNEKRIPGLFQYFTTKGIIGIYASVIIVIWGLIRTATSEMYIFVRYYTLPNVDTIYQLCHDIYLARESGELALEEDLFAKLLFIFRSPETMVKWTKKK